MTDSNHNSESNGLLGVSKSSSTSQSTGDIRHVVDAATASGSSNRNTPNKFHSSASNDMLDTGHHVDIGEHDTPTSMTYKDRLVMGVSTNVNEAYTLLRDAMMKDSAEAGHEEVEMLDYDNAVDHVADKRLHSDGNNTGSKNLKLTVIRVTITILVGIAVGLTGYFVSHTVSALIHTNLNILGSLMNSDRPILAFFSILSISVSLTFIASLCVTFGSWQVRGSGVGRLNAYLSGMYSSKFLTFRTLVFKVIGIILNVSSGIKHGMEGPFIHIGAMLGLHVSRACISTARLFGRRFGIEKYLSIVSGVVDERVFITAGAAAGFSVAFNAPIAGVVYVMDGAFAYWNGEYTLRTFTCTMTAVITLNLCFISGNNVLPTRGLIDVDRPAATEIVLAEFYGFIVLGILGGVLGALFTRINLEAEKLRQKYLGRRRLHNVLDVMACTVATVLVSFVLPFLFTCATSHTICEDHPDRCLRFSCGPDQYSSLATLFFTPPNEAIRMLFDRTMHIDTTGSAMVLAVFFVTYFFLCCLSYNMAVPGGLFIPSIIIGGAYGRLLGIGMQNIITPPTDDPQLGINPGVYAVLGAASMLGGMTRMTLPISVMMIEITSDAQFLIPIMLVVLVAKAIADRLIGGLYAEHLKLDGLVMVFGDKLPRKLKTLTAKEIMSLPPLISLSVVDTVSNAYSAIRDTKHHAFPVTDSDIASVHKVSRKSKQQQQEQRQSVLRPSEILQRTATMGDAPYQSSSDSLQNGHSSSHKLTASAAQKQQTNGQPPPPTKTTGIFLGLVQRRHLNYLLSNRPCYSSAIVARDAEPLTTTLFDTSNGHTNASRDSDAHSATKVSRQISAPAPIAHDQLPRSPGSGPADRNGQSRYAPSLTAVGANPRMDAAPLLAGSRFATSAAVEVRDNLMNHWVNLAPFMDTGAYIVSEETSARRIWSLFRSVGMRHIVVVNERHQPVGMITRHDLIHFAVS